MTTMNAAWKAAEVLRKRATEGGYSLSILTDSVVDLAPPVIIEIKDRNGVIVFRTETNYKGTPEAIMDGLRRTQEGRKA